MASDEGLRHFFTTVQMPEADISGRLQEFRQIAHLAETRHLRIMADVHPIAFKRVGGSVSDLEPFREIGITDLRLDAGFSDDDIAQLQRTATKLGMTITLNASALTEDMIEKLKQLHFPVEGSIACHNYYPRIESGMSTAYIRQQAKLLHKHGIKIIAFVASEFCHRFITYEGLPTLEVHRTQRADLAARELLTRQWADMVYIGDQTDNQEEIRRFIAVAKSPHLVLRLKLNPYSGRPEREIVLNRIHEHLPQDFEVTYRARGDRQRPELRFIAPQTRNLSRPRGTVAVDNALYPRYAGEVHIAKQDLPPDPRCNVVGQIITEDLRLLNSIGPTVSFGFEVVGPEND
jgi:hypothetical protein